MSDVLKSAEVAKAAQATVVDLMAADTALLSLRSSGHDHMSAVGEVIDNSLQANANNIRCRIFSEKRVVGKNKRATDVVERLAIGDDGDGMDQTTLHHSLRLGFSTRYNDRKGMGRFGVGAKMGGISQAKRIDIYSRQSAELPWLHTYIDLDEIKEHKQEHIPQPTPVDLPRDCKDLVGERGTLVVWSKTDRLAETESGGGRAADTARQELTAYIGRTFRKFIDSGRNIELDGKKVFAHDPLFLMTSTRFHQNGEADPVGTVAFTSAFDFPLPSDPSKTSRVEVTLTLLPKEFRRTRGEGGNKFAESRRIDENEGVSILRADREIFHGWLRGVQPSQDGREIDRFIGKEIRFEPDLDEWFQVRNVKKGAEPVESLRDRLKEQIFKTIISLREEVRRYFNEVESQTLQDQGIHSEAEKIATETQRTARKPKAGKDVSKEDREKEIDAAAEALVKNVPDDIKPQKKAQIKAKIEKQPFTIVPETWPGREFLDVKHFGENALVKMNMSHPFYTEVYSRLVAAEKQDEDAALKELARRVRNGIDLLVLALVRAEGQYENTEDTNYTEIYADLLTNWGLELRHVIQHWAKKQ